MSGWIAPTRRTLVAAWRPRVVLASTRVAVRFCAERNFLLLAIDSSPVRSATPATGSNQYRSYLARIGACVRLLATLRKDATRKKRMRNTSRRRGVRAGHQQGEPT